MDFQQYHHFFLQRILITKWAGDAWGRLVDRKYNAFRRRLFEKTGCLLTATGEADNKVQPEGLPGYQVPPVVASRKPYPQLPVSNGSSSYIEELPEEEVVVDDFEAEDNDVELFKSSESDGNVFDLFDLVF